MISRRLLNGCAASLVWAALAGSGMVELAQAGPISVGNYTYNYTGLPHERFENSFILPVDETTAGYSQDAMIFNIASYPRGTVINSASFTVDATGSQGVFFSNAALWDGSSCIE